MRKASCTSSMRRATSRAPSAPSAARSARSRRRRRPRQEGCETGCQRPPGEEGPAKKAAAPAKKPLPRRPPAKAGQEEESSSVCGGDLFAGLRRRKRQRPTLAREPAFCFSDLWTAGDGRGRPGTARDGMRTAGQRLVARSRRRAAKKSAGARASMKSTMRRSKRSLYRRLAAWMPVGT